MNGSWGHESADANTFAGWGVDTLKNDWCYNKGDAIEAAAPSAFRKMRDALNATGRTIIYAIHGTGGPVWPTYYADAPAIANSWRMGGDIEGPMRPSWTRILRCVCALDIPAARRLHPDTELANLAKSKSRLGAPRPKSTLVRLRMNVCAD